MDWLKYMLLRYFGKNIEMEDAISDKNPQVDTPVLDIPIEQPVLHKQRYTWMLDYGHDRFQAGKRSPVLNGKRFFEWQFNQDVGSRITKRLDEIGVNYVVVVDYKTASERRVKLKERVKFINSYKSSLPKVGLSIHSNASTKNINEWGHITARGVETWYFKGSILSAKLAKTFQSHLINNTSFKNRWLKITTLLYILRYTKCPIALTESGFYDNKMDIVQLNKDDVREKIAEAHVQAILEIENNGL